MREGTEGRRNNTKTKKVKIEDLLPVIVLDFKPEIKPVTLAREYVNNNQIKEPCFITVAECDDEGKIIKPKARFFWNGSMHEGNDARKFPGYILSAIQLNQRRQQQLQCC